MNETVGQVRVLLLNCLFENPVIQTQCCECSVLCSLSRISRTIVLLLILIFNEVQTVPTSLEIEIILEYLEHVTHSIDIMKELG